MTKNWFYVSFPSLGFLSLNLGIIILSSHSYFKNLIKVIAIIKGQKQILKSWKLENQCKIFFFDSVWYLNVNHFKNIFQLSSVAQSCLTLCDPNNRSTPGLSVHYQVPEFTQTHVHWVSDAIQHLILSSPSPPASNLSQHQGLFKCQVANVLEFQLQHQSFQWIFRTHVL